MACFPRTLPRPQGRPLLRGSAVEATPPSEVPENTSLPVGSGIETVAQTLTTTNGGWQNGPFTLTERKWQSADDGSGTNAADIGGADSATYVIALAAGKYARPAVRRTNVVGTSDWAYGEWIGPIAAALSISGTPDTSATIGDAYSWTPTLAGGHTPYVVTLASGTLPAGLSLNSATGAITGTPTTEQTASGLVLRVTDADGLTDDLDAFTITVSAAADVTAPTITSANSANVVEGVTAVITCTADEAVTWSITGGADAAYFAINSSTGVLTFVTGRDYETPVDGGANNTYVVQVTATDAATNATNQTFTATVTDADEIPAAFSFTDVTDATVSTQYTSNTITVAGLGSGVSVPVTITGGTYSKNGGGYTSSAGMAVNGDTFAVRHTSSGSNATATNTALTIGGVSDTFTTTTEAAVSLRDAVLAISPGPKLMWDGKDGTTLFQGANGAGGAAGMGDPVRAMLNLSTLGGYFNTPSDSQRPIRTVDGLLHDGVDDGFQYAGLTLGATLYLGIRANITSAGMLAEHSANAFASGGGIGGFYCYGSNGGTWMESRAGNVVFNNDGTANWSLGDHRSELQFVSGASDATLLKDGVVVPDGTVTVLGSPPTGNHTDTLNLMFRNGGSAVAGGTMTRGVIFEQELTGADLATVRAWLDS